MESSIAEFLLRQPACERLPTITIHLAKENCFNFFHFKLLMQYTVNMAWKAFGVVARAGRYPCGRGNSAISDA